MSANSKIPSMPNVAFLGLLMFLCLYPGVGTAEQIVDTEPHVVLELGTRGILPCRIQRRGYSFEWKRQVASESKLIVSLNPFSVDKRYGPGYEAGMFNITDDYSLVIKGVTVQDEGIYICLFYDYQTGIIFRNSTRVSVQGFGTAEQIVDTEPHVVLELGTRGVLPCRIKRRAYSVAWKRQVASESGSLVSLNPFSVDKRYGPGYEAGMFNITEDYSLVIKDVKVQDEGIYICSFADYQTGITFKNSTRVSIQGVGTAERIVDTEPHVVLELGTRGVLPCRIQRRAFSVGWKRQIASESGLIVSLNPFSVGKRYGPGYEAGMFNITDDYSLVIKDVKVQDEGIYICLFYDYQTGITFRNGTRVSVQEEENRMDGNTTIPNTMAGVTRDSDLFVFEDYNQRIAKAAILFTVFLVGSVGNTRVITPVLFSLKLRSTTKTNWFVVNLGCADLLTCLALPLNILALLSREGWPLPGWICAANAAVYMISLGASVMTLALIAYNRFYLLTRPKARFQKLYTTRNVCIMVLITWLYPAILVLVPHFAGLGRLGYSYEYKTCTQDTSLPTSNWYSFIAGAGLIIPVFIAVAVIYLRIYLSSRSEVSQPGGIDLIMSSSCIPSTQPNTFDLAIVVLAFLVSLLPFGVNVLVVAVAEPVIPFTGLMLTFNTCVNPFIYDRTMPDFRETAEGQS